MKIEKTGKEALAAYIYRYPQLTLSVAEGMSTSRQYKDIVLRGKLPHEYPDRFCGTEEDCIYRITTPIGEAEILYVANREDFERFVQVLAYKCENVEIPASMGAIHISGINNWRKIQLHKKEYLQEGHLDWNAEFKRFTAKAEQYKDTATLVSKGAYSALSASETPYSETEWLAHSLNIRIYHELTHLMCRRLYPERKDALWDEIVADCIGVYQALGHYDAELAEKFLGVEGNTYRAGGRMENYVKDPAELEQAQQTAKRMIHRIAVVAQENKTADPWVLLEKIQQLSQSDSHDCITFP